MSRGAQIVRTASTLPPSRARQMIAALVAGSAETDFKKQAADAFESDMQPVCKAIVSALKADDMHALQGLRALLPHLLEEVNAAPALADLLAHQLGRSLLDGLKSKPEDTL